MRQELATDHDVGDDPDVSKLSQHVMVRVSPEQLKAWQASADKIGGNLADWIRVVCDTASKREWPSEDEMEEMVARGQMIPVDAPGAKRVLDRFMAGEITVRSAGTSAKPTRKRTRRG